MEYSSRGRSRHTDDEEDDEEAGHPALPQSHRRTPEASTSAPPDLSGTASYTAAGEVIVKIEAPENADDRRSIRSKKTRNTSGSGTSEEPMEERDNPPSSGDREFSFRRPDDAPMIEDEQEGTPETPTPAPAPTPEDATPRHGVRGEIYMRDQLEDLNRRQGQGLPPLPRDGLTRQSWGRNPSEIQSPDLAAYNNYRNSMAQQSPAPTNNFDGSAREIRVSFQESIGDSGQLKRRASLYSTVDLDDSTSASSSGVDEDYTQEDDGITKVSPGGGGNASGEFLRIRSNSATLRRFPSHSMSKMKSRLLDPPSTPLDQRSGNLRKSFIKRSGVLGKSARDEDEDDPFIEDDVPEELKRAPISTSVIIEWVSLVSILGALICTLIIPVLKEKYLWKMQLWKWEVMILALICGGLVSGWAIRIIVFFIQKNFILRKRVLYFVYGLKRSVQIVIWCSLVIITWHCLFDKRVKEVAHSKPLNHITRLLDIGIIIASLWLLKTFIVKVCDSSFHVNKFFDRVQEAIFNHFVIETLTGPPTIEHKLAHEEELSAYAEVQMLQNAGINVPPELRATAFSPLKSGNLEGTGGTPQRTPIGYSSTFSGPISKKHDEFKKFDEGITIEDLQKLNQRNVSAWNMKRLMKIIRKGTLMNLDEQMVGSQDDDEQSGQNWTEVQAKAVAKKIFRNVAKPHARHIYLEDLKRFMREDEAIKTMALFDGVAETQRISKKALKDWVVKAFRERRALSLTLNDTKSAVNKLHKMVNFLFIIVVIVVVAITYDYIRSESLVFICSQLVLVAFVFGNTCKNVFESIIFLFIIHPFDVGDRCEIDGVQMVVEEMNILTTIFLRYDNLKIIYPNYVLLTKPINNFYRSPDMGDGVEFACPIATPPEKIALMREKILSYIQNKKEHWYPTPMIILKDVESFHTLKMAVWLQHKMNHQDMGQRFFRRALLVEECIKIFQELDIEYRFMPVSVNFNSMPPWPGYPPPVTSPAASPSPLAEAGREAFGLPMRSVSETRL